LLAAAVVWSPAQALAKAEWAVGTTRRVPNASVYLCVTCHTSNAATGCGAQCNAFGLAFKANANAWSPALAAGDADLDSFPDGWELQDPSGAWTVGSADPGDPTLVANPGDAASSPPRIGVDPSSIAHTEVAGTNGMESFTVQNTGGNCAGNLSGPCALAFDVATDVTWALPDPTGGVDSTLIALLFETSALAAGIYEGTASVTAAGVINSPLDVPITLTVPEPSANPLRVAALLSLALLARRSRRRDAPIAPTT
jgi:hypothetical protein